MPPRGRKYEWTAAAIAEVGAAGFLFVGACVLLFLAVGRWRVKSATIAALEAHDRGEDPAAVAGACRSALEVDAADPIARQLLAKVLVEQGKAAEAEREYRVLIDGGYGRPNAQVGMGVVHLLQADAEKDRAKAVELAKKARRAFEEARRMDAGCVEARIGLAQADLFLSRRSGVDRKSAYRAFLGILKDLETRRELRAKVSREALVDLYSGLGRAACDPEVFRPEAGTYFRTCYKYAPGAASILANLLAVDAQRFVSRRFTRKELDADPEIHALGEAVTSYLGETRPLREAYLQRELAIAYAYGMAGASDRAEARIKGLLEDRFKDRIDPLRLRAHVYQVLAKRSGMLAKAKASTDHATLAARGRDAFQALAKHPRAGKVLRATALNNAAVLRERQGAHSKTDRPVESEKHLAEALRLDGDDYLLNRNMAIVQWKLRKDPKPYLARARRAAGRSEERLRDLNRVEGFLR